MKLETTTIRSWFAEASRREGIVTSSAGRCGDIGGLSLEFLLDRGLRLEAYFLDIRCVCLKERGEDITGGDEE